MKSARLFNEMSGAAAATLPTTEPNPVPKGLAEHAISSGTITATSQALKFGLTLLTAMILGRLLTPGDFGLVGMVGTITGLLSMFTDAGLSTAAVQASRLDQGQASNLFWINLFLGGVMGLAAGVLAAPIAWFYHDSRLVPITLVLALTFPLTGVALQHRALLNRQMNFRTLAIIEVGAMATSVLVSCLMAAFHFGYWSLVGMQLSAAIAGSALTWWKAGWCPGLPRVKGHSSALIRFGVGLTVSSFIHRISRGSDTLLLGRFWGAHAVGLYSRASVLLLRPIDQFLAPIGSVLLPLLSKLQQDPRRYRSAFLRTYDAIGLISFPVSALILALARPFVLVLLGPKWDGAVSLFAGFTATALYMPLAFSATWLFTTQGRGRDMVIANVILSVLTLVSFVGGLPFGALGMILCFSLSGLLIRLPILYYLAGRKGPVHYADLWAVLLRHLPVWAAVYAATTLLHFMVRRLTDFEQLLICVPFGLLVAATSMCVLSHHRRLVGFLLSHVKVVLVSRRILLKEVPA